MGSSLGGGRGCRSRSKREQGATCGSDCFLLLSPSAVSRMMPEWCWKKSQQPPLTSALGRHWGPLAVTP